MAQYLDLAVALPTHIEMAAYTTNRFTTEKNLVLLYSLVEVVTIQWQVLLVVLVAVTLS